jgi:hypothetical protein
VQSTVEMTLLHSIRTYLLRTSYLSQHNNSKQNPTGDFL